MPVLSLAGCVTVVDDDVSGLIFAGKVEAGGTDTIGGAGAVSCAVAASEVGGVSRGDEAGAGSIAGTGEGGRGNCAGGRLGIA